MQRFNQSTEAACVRKKDMSGKEKTITDEQWEAVEALIPLIGKQKEWEVSS